MRQLQWMVFQQDPVGYYLHYAKNKTSNGTHYICITTQQKYTSLKYRDRSSQLSWVVEIMDVIEEAWLVFATRCQFLTPSTTWALIWHLQWSERKSFLPCWSKRLLATAGKEMSWNMRQNKKRNFTALLC